MWELSTFTAVTRRKVDPSRQHFPRRVSWTRDPRHLISTVKFANRRAHTPARRTSYRIEWDIRARRGGGERAFLAFPAISLFVSTTIGGRANLIVSKRAQLATRSAQTANWKSQLKVIRVIVRGIKFVRIRDGGEKGKEMCKFKRRGINELWAGEWYSIKTTLDN